MIARLCPLRLLGDSLAPSCAQSLYSRRLRLSMHPGPNFVLDVLRVANFLDVACVLTACLAYVRTRLLPSNVLRFAALCEAHGLTDVRSAALEFVCDNFEALAVHPQSGGGSSSSAFGCDPGLTGLDRSLLVEILQSDRLRLTGEISVFRALMAWLDANDDSGFEVAVPARGAASSPAALTTSPVAALMAAGASASPVAADADAQCAMVLECNSQPGSTPGCPPDLLALVRFQHIPLEQLYREVSTHPRLQSLAAKQCIIDTFAYHSGLANGGPARTGIEPQDVVPPGGVAAAVSAEAKIAAAGEPPRRYLSVDSRTVCLDALLRVKDNEDMVRGLCDTLPPDAPIKFVARMKQTIGQVGRLVQKSRRGSLKLQFDLPELPEDRRQFWYPAEALMWGTS